MVVPAGDRLYPDCLQEMVLRTATSSSIALVGAYQRRMDEILLSSLPYDQTVFGGRDIVRRMLLENAWVIGSASSLMICAAAAPHPFLDPAFRNAHVNSVVRMLLVSDLGMVHQVLTYNGDPEARRGDRADRIRSTFAEDLVLLLRHGRDVLADDEYEAAYSRCLTRYRRSQLKNALKPHRLVDDEFVEFHRHMAGLLVDANDGRQKTRETAELVSLLLRRRLRPTNGAER
jgi:hypothetical protein